MNSNLSDNNTRNYGIDLLRIVSMFFIVILHALGRGGIIYNARIYSIPYKVSWMLEIIAYPAVNIFALITGYVSYREKEKRQNFTNYILLWLEVVFYGGLVTLIFEIIDSTSVTINDLLTTMFPITNGLYWYFTAYTALFFFIPFLNNAIRNTSIKDLKYFFWIIIIVFAIFDTVAQRFTLDKGYSFIWLMLCYILGAIIKKCRIGENFKNYKIIGGIIIFYIITYLYKMYGFEYKLYDFKLAFIDVNVTKDLFVSYTSPTILVTAILYLIGFSKMKFNKLMIKIIKFIAPSAFAIYLLNNHRLIWNNVIQNMFLFVANGPVVKTIGYPIIFAVCFVIAAILIDKIRQFIFSKLHIKEIVDKLLKLFIKE